MNNELYLKTAFCCMACDGDIAAEEVELIKKYIKNGVISANIETEEIINGYIKSINSIGISFLNMYLKELKNAILNLDEQLQIIKIAVEIIESDNEILYSELKFFKRIRQCLTITDEEILAVLPDKADYLLPDIQQQEYEFICDTKFVEIKIGDL